MFRPDKVHYAMECIMSEVQYTIAALQSFFLVVP